MALQVTSLNSSGAFVHVESGCLVGVCNDFQMMSYDC